MSAPKPGDLVVSKLTGRTHRTVLMVDGSDVWLAHGDEATRHPLETFDKRWEIHPTHKVVLRIDLDGENITTDYLWFVSGAETDEEELVRLALGIVYERERQGLEDLNPVIEEAGK